MRMFDWFLCVFMCAVVVFHFNFMKNHPDLNRFPASQGMEMPNWHWECGKI